MAASAFGTSALALCIAAGAFGVASAIGCAPSHRMVHDGNVYFEHCYSADFKPSVADGPREACWNAWLAHYTRHQPAHRIDYAMRRVEALQQGESTLPLPGISEHPVATTPPPTQVEGLVTLEGPRAGSEVATLLDPAASPTGIPHGCDQACTTLESACTAKCPVDALPCRESCDHDRTLCLGGCY